MSQRSPRTEVPGPDVAFLILAHDDIAMLARLCARLAPNNVYIHIDRRSHIDQREVERFGSKVRFVENRIETHWADFSLVEATLTLMKAALDVRKHTHLVLLSGHCYPIRPIAELVKFLGENPDRNFLQLVEVHRESFLFGRFGRHWRMRPIIPGTTHARTGALAKLDQFLVRVFNKVSGAFPRDFYKEIYPGAPFFGSQWWALTSQAAERVVRSAASRSIMQSFRSTFAPDETYIQTVLGNLLEPFEIIGPKSDHGPASVLDAPLHLIADTEGRWMIDTPDHRRAIQSSEKFFVRKVTSDQVSLLDWIDKKQQEPGQK